MLKKLVIGILVVAMIAPFGIVAAIMGRTLWAHASGQHAYAEGQSGAVAAAGETRTACPFGLVNDPYPGACRRYVDRDGNGICDLSETPAAGAVAASEEACASSAAGEPQGQQGARLGQTAHTGTALVTAQGTVIALEPELEIMTAQGALHIGMGPSDYRQAQGFAPHLGDELLVIGFAEDGELKAIEAWNLTTGQKITLRQMNGQPMWSGQGRGRNRP